MALALKEWGLRKTS